MESFETARGHFLAGRLGQAETLCREILGRHPDDAGALHLLGQIASRAGRYEAAVGFITRAIRFAPKNAEAHQDLATALLSLGRIDEAIAAYRDAINLRDDFAEAHANLGIALGLRNQYGDSINAFRRALELRPDAPEVHDGLGVALRSDGQVEAAVESHRRAIQLRGDFAAAHFNLGLALSALGLIDEAVAEFRLALKINPSYLAARSGLIYTLPFQADADALAIYQEHVLWNRVHAQPLARLQQPHANIADGGRRIRVGYISPDFREHSVSYFIETILAAHDSALVEVFCYADRVAPDATTGRLRTWVPHWREIANRSDQDVCGLIRKDQIDILVDLAGHTGGNRLAVFAMRPAPVQVTYLGYIGSTGLVAIDYRMTDALADPPGMTEQFHSERLLRLPRTFACYRPPEDAPAVAPLPALLAGHVTFGSFNTLEKINERLLECWCKILGRVPRSRLIMVAQGLRHPSVQQRILALFGRNDIEPDRLTLMDKQPFEEYLLIHQRVDLMLDTFPVNGHTVSCHGLWMGLPVISLAGNSYCQRLGLSVMNNIGLNDLIARTPEEYIKITVKLATDVSRLGELRATMRRRMESSPLMDAPGFARDVEAAYRNIWQSWCAARTM